MLFFFFFAFVCFVCFVFSFFFFGVTNSNTKCTAARMMMEKIGGDLCVLVHKKKHPKEKLASEVR